MSLSIFLSKIFQASAPSGDDDQAMRVLYMPAVWKEDIVEISRGAKSISDAIGQKVTPIRGDEGTDVDPASIKDTLLEISKRKIKQYQEPPVTADSSFSGEISVSGEIRDKARRKGSELNQHLVFHIACETDLVLCVPGAGKSVLESLASALRVAEKIDVDTCLVLNRQLHLINPDTKFIDIINKIEGPGTSRQPTPPKL